MAQMQHDYILEVEIPPASPTAEESVEGIAYLYGASGVILENHPTHDLVRVYFDDAESRSAAAGALAATGSYEARNVDLPRRDWLELYEQSLTPIAIGAKFVVAPDIRLIPASERIPIVIPQERAFGTGSHETTALCIEMLEGIELASMIGADIGTGSAILAIAMARLGCERVIAFDNDPEAYEAIRANLERNSIPWGRVSPYIGGIEALRGVEFDVATMNIIPEVIIPLLPLVRERIRTGGTIVFSGILCSVRDEFVAATAPGFSLIEERTRGEWWCGRFEAR